MVKQVAIRAVNKLINRAIAVVFTVVFVLTIAVLPACTAKNKSPDIKSEVDRKIPLDNYLGQVRNGSGISSGAIVGALVGSMVGGMASKADGAVIGAAASISGVMPYKSHTRFPCNYWKSSSRCNVANLFSDLKIHKYADVDEILVSALRECGLNDFIYLMLDCPANGFVLVTDFEQVDRSGYRCQEKIPRQPDRKLLWEVVSGHKSVLDYLTSLFTNNPGYYRIFAFVVSNQQVIADTTKNQIDSTIIEQWKNGGLLQLPQEFAAVGFDKNTKIEALVYEFEITNSGKYFIADSSLSGYDSLERSGIVSAIKTRRFAQ
jgi:hypothetical protein